MAEKRDRRVIIEGARIIFRNFAGAEKQFNRAGDRNFSVLLDPELAKRLEDDGWNVSYLKVRPDDEDPIPQAHLKVKLKFTGKPPTIYMISSRGRTALGEDTVELLDMVDISNVDLIIDPYDYDVNGKTGISAYLSSIYVTIIEDELALKYADVEDADRKAL